MTNLKRVLGEANAAVFASLGLPIEYARITVSDRPDLADFQANGALAVAKSIGRNPREIAADVAERLKADPRFTSVEIAGPGFINLRLTDAALTERANAIAADPRAGAPTVEARRVLVDYGGPNVAKPMHVGHLRASIIGESLKRLFRFLGDDVLGDAHFGDWGFQMGLLIVAASDENPDWARVAEQDEGEVEGLDLDVLDRLYPLAAGRAKEDKDYRDRARRATAALQSGKPGYRRLWRRFVEVSRTALQREFDDLDVTFDLWKGESDADPFVGPMIEDLVAKGLLVDDNGARVVHVARPGETAKRKHKDGSITISPSPPPLLVVSSEGSAMYGTTDLATIVDRRQGFDPQLMLYVVDERQAEHFEQVFRAAYLAGYAQEKSLEHLGFGTVNGPDGKPFKTREGGVLKLHDLIEMAREKARERLREAGLGAELDPAEFEATAHKVAVAAIKFADLQNFRGASYVFDLDRFTSFEGKTGPYMLYQAVRIKSLLRRAADEGLAPGPIAISEPAERELVLALDAVDAALSEAYAKRAPNLMAEHAYRLGATFSKFYAACPVLIAPTPTLRASRLALASTTLRQMQMVLDLLGIATPARM